MFDRLLSLKARLSPDELRLQQTAARELKKEETPLSPCISVCRMSDQTGLCEGCFRTLDEITGWGHCPPEAKRDMWRLIQQRLQAKLQA
ncbi:DUF1289 domain-containing protein [Limnohabitans sp.]|uniref:DUF1289 domain-containing protein n=1 Tax=Limnohabitans sp. TaxID=1907725 RepID=UPI0033411C05